MLQLNDNVLNTPSEYIYFTCQKSLLHTLFLLVIKIVETLQCILNCVDRSGKYSLFILRKQFTLLCVIPSVLLAESFQLRSICSSQKLITKQIFLFEYINFLKIILEEESFVMKAKQFGKCFTRKSKNRQSQGVHFQSIWRQKFGKFLYLSVPVCTGLP